MKALTTSELNKILLTKGYKEYRNYNLPQNKWGADYFSIIETEDGYSAIDLSVQNGEYMSKRIFKYNNMKSADKKEFTSLVLSI